MASEGSLIHCFCPVREGPSGGGGGGRWQGGGGGTRHRRTLFGIPLLSCWAACSPQSPDMFSALRCLKGMWSQGGRWFGSAHCAGSELSNCVGGFRREGERERKLVKRRRRLGVLDAKDMPQTAECILNFSMKYYGNSRPSKSLKS